MYAWNIGVTENIFNKVSYHESMYAWNIGVNR